MRDRLSEMIDGFRELEAPSDGRTWTEHLADHLLTAGVIVPPCKVGDTVFVTDIIGGHIVECEVVSFGCIDEEGVGTITYEVPREIPEIVSVESLICEIGETIFLTREEAERALAERREE